MLLSFGLIFLLCALCNGQTPTPVACQISDPDKSGWVYNLSPLTKPVGGTDWKTSSAYPDSSIVLNICAPVRTLSPFCDSNTGMCEVPNSNFGSGLNIGSYATTFTVVSEGQLQMNFPGNTGCSGTITFVCDELVGDGTPVFEQMSGSCTYSLKWTTTHACSQKPGGSGGLSIGSILCIIFFVSFFVYIAAGMVYKNKKFGATGTDMVPNIEFWRELPGLFKDGCRFVAQKTFNK